MFFYPRLLFMYYTCIIFLSLPVWFTRTSRLGRWDENYRRKRGVKKLFILNFVDSVSGRIVGHIRVGCQTKPKLLHTLTESKYKFYDRASFVARPPSPPHRLTPWYESTEDTQGDFINKKCLTITRVLVQSYARARASGRLEGQRGRRWVGVLNIAYHRRFQTDAKYGAISNFVGVAVPRATAAAAAADTAKRSVRGRPELSDTCRTERKRTEIPIATFSVPTKKTVVN